MNTLKQVPSRLGAICCVALLCLGACRSLEPTGKLTLAEVTPVGRTDISSYEECVAAGNAILRTLPPRCMTADGITFIEERSGFKVKAGVESQKGIEDLGLEGRGSPQNAPKTGESACRNLCGDGECQEIVCMAVGCPCPESAVSCPRDCK